MNSPASKVFFIGAGIVNLVTAYIFSQKGFRVHIFDKCDDPFIKGDWVRQGATYGGENARMYSLTEADNYNEKKSKIYRNMSNVFESSIAENGWRVIDKFTTEEDDWIARFKSIPPDSAKSFAADIYRLNILSGGLWQELIEREPELFEGANLRHDIVRVYSHKSDFNAAQALHKKLGSFISVVSPEAMPDYLPCHAYSLTEKMLGGIMKVKGFTLQIHNFCFNLIKALQKNGAVFSWNQELKEILKNDSGQVQGVRIGEDILEADHYVISLGAYAGKTFDNLSCRNRIHGVLGIWLSLNDPYNLRHSFKIHKRGHIGEDTNVTLVETNGRKKLVLGSGYGYMGNMHSNTVAPDHLKPIYDSLMETARVYFRKAYDATVENGTLADNWKYCVRPFTPNGLGIFEVARNVGGGFTFITGGHNTGGFTQAPIVAQSVFDVLQNRNPLMAQIYQLDRF